LEALNGSVTSAMSVVSRGSPCALSPQRAVVVSLIASASLSEMQTSPASCSGLVLGADEPAAGATAVVVEVEVVVEVPVAALATP
jgi:hypothetical protein